MKPHRWFGLFVAVLVLSVWAFAGEHEHEGDLLLGYEGDVLTILSPEALTQEPYRLTVNMEPTGLGIYVVDIGFDFAHGDHDHTISPLSGDEPMLKQVTIRQLFVSPELFGVVEGNDAPIFGIGTVGELTLMYDPDDPEAAHKHVGVRHIRVFPEAVAVPVGGRNRPRRQSAWRLTRVYHQVQSGAGASLVGGAGNGRGTTLA